MGRITNNHLKAIEFVSELISDAHQYLFLTVWVFYCCDFLFYTSQSFKCCMKYVAVYSFAIASGHFTHLLFNTSYTFPSKY